MKINIGEKMKLEELKKEYDALQQKYGAKELDSIYFGGCEQNQRFALYL